jgi:hypothetical protein
METIKPQFIEIIVRGKKIDVEKAATDTGISEFMVGSDDENKYVFQIPTDWDGWNKNRVFEMIDSKFSKEAYFGLSLVSMENLLVVDDKGEVADSFPVSHGGVAQTKWVKKKMIIVKRIMDKNRESKWVLVSGWKFDGRYTPPMTNFLDLKVQRSGLPRNFNFDRMLNAVEEQ